MPGGGAAPRFRLRPGGSRVGWQLELGSVSVLETLMIDDDGNVAAGFARAHVTSHPGAIAGGPCPVGGSRRR